MKKDTSVNEFNKWGGGERWRARREIEPLKRSSHDDTIIEAVEAREEGRRDDSKDGEREKERVRENV